MGKNINPKEELSFVEDTYKQEFKLKKKKGRSYWVLE